MIIAGKKNHVHFQSLNDIDYVLGQIPRELADRQSRLDPATKVKFTVEVDGVYTRSVPFKRDTPQGITSLAAVTKHLVADEDDRLTFNSITTNEVFNVRIKIKLEFKRLDECNGEEVVAQIRKRLEELKKLGVNMKAPQPEESDDD